MTRGPAAAIARAVVLAAAVAWPAAAPAEPLYAHLRLIAPAAPGGGWDQTARAMQAVLQEAGLVATSSVENIPGAAGTIGLARFINAERGSGDVLMLSGLIMLGAVVTHQSPVTLRQVTPIARLLGEYEVIVVPAGSPIATLADLVARMRASPEAVSWGGGSAGGTDQILAGLFADAIGVPPRRVTYIAYSGGGESLSAILGAQVTVGVNGLAELAPHIESGAVRAIAISSEARVPGVDVPTFREQGVDVVIENWRSVVAPPGISDAERQRLEAVTAAMVQSVPWREALTRYRWNDRYLAGTAFARFSAAEEARVESILARLGTGRNATASVGDLGRYPLFVLAGLLLSGTLSVRGIARARLAARTSLVMADRGTTGNATDVGSAGAAADRVAEPAVRSGWPALGLVAAAAILDLLLLESAGFIVASTVLFWMTARAFDRTRPGRDAAMALAVSVGAYVLFVRLLQLSLPPGLMAGWL